MTEERHHLTDGRLRRDTAGRVEYAFSGEVCRRSSRLPQRFAMLHPGRFLVFLLLAASAAAAEPRTAREFYDRGQKREKQDPQAALADYNRAIEIELFFGEAILTRAHLLADLRRYEDAIADYTTYLEIHPGDYSALFNRGSYRQLVGLFDLAVADYSDILDGEVDFSRTGTPRDEALAHAHHYRGRVYLYDLKQTRKAIADFDAAIRLHPETEMVHYRRGTAWHDVGEYAKAVADYEEATKRAPDYPNLLNARAWQLATCPDARFRNGQFAVAFATQACDGHNWKIPEHVATAAAAYAEAGQIDEAVAKQKLALSLLTKPQDRRRKPFEERLALYERRQPFREEPAKAE